MVFPGFVMSACHTPRVALHFRSHHLEQAWQYPCGAKKMNNSYLLIFYSVSDEATTTVFSFEDEKRLPSDLTLLCRLRSGRTSTRLALSNNFQAIDPSRKGKLWFLDYESYPAGSQAIGLGGDCKIDWSRRSVDIKWTYRVYAGHRQLSNVSGGLAL